jgi:hypothetical protein
MLSGLCKVLGLDLIRRDGADAITATNTVLQLLSFF